MGTVKNTHGLPLQFTIHKCRLSIHCKIIQSCGRNQQQLHQQIPAALGHIARLHLGTPHGKDNLLVGLFWRANLVSRGILIEAETHVTYSFVSHAIVIEIPTQ